MAVTKDQLKKHHFWVLVGVVPLLVLLAMLTTWSSVGGAIETRDKEIDKKIKELAGKTNPKADGTIAALGTQKGDLLKKRQELWAFYWNQQKPWFTWPGTRRPNPDTAPASPKLEQLQQAGLKFGDPIPERFREDLPEEEFRRDAVYKAEYQRLADQVSPTQFARAGAATGAAGVPGKEPTAAWQTVFRWVNDWGPKKPSADQLWLAMEDLWVQRSLMDAVATVNDSAAAFQRLALKDAKTGKVIDEPLRRRFKSRLWEVELWVEKRGTKQILKATLKNATDRLQLLGIGNTMVLHVWLDKGIKDPFEFRVEGEFVKAGDTVEVKEVPAYHTIPDGATVTELFKVRQKFDSRTVPVRRIDHVVIGQLSDRNAYSLKDKADKLEAKGAAAAADPSADPAMAAGAATAIPGGEGMPGMPGMPGGAGAAAQVSGGGPVGAVLDANKKRYLGAPTEQVRRLPVGMTLVLDQMYMQDLLVALANNPLRFQTTQVGWERFRATLDDAGAAGGGAGSSDGPGVASAARVGFGDAFGPNRGFAPAAEGAAPSPTGAGGGSISGAQMTAGLVAAYVYGVVSLYEKYTPAAGGQETAAAKP